jgi:cytochrome P450
MSGTPHAANRHINFNGYSIPKGTILLPNFLAMNRNRDKYSNPNIFDPLRFLGDDKDAASLARNSNYLERDHYHFGFGRRFCPGSHIAEGAMYIITIRVLWAFHVKPMRGVSLNMKDQRGTLII